MDSATINKQLEEFRATRANPLDVYNKQQEELGVGDVRTRVKSLRESILNTENLLNNVDSSVTGRTQGSLVTEAQRQRLAQLESKPIYGQLNKLQGNYQQETADFNELMGQASQRANLIYQGDQAKEQGLLTSYQAAVDRERYAAEQARLAQQAAEEQRRWQLQYDMQQRQFQAQLAAARRGSASRSSAPTPQQARDQYNVSLDGLESALRSYQAAGYRGDIGSRQQTKNALIAQFRGYISPQEINGYVDTLYNRYYVR